MKRLLPLLIFILPLFIQAQDRTAVYLPFQPSDLGFGIRADYYIKQFGFYNSATYGDNGLYRIFGLRSHVKLSAGVLIPLPDYHGCQFEISAGFNYHTLADTHKFEKLDPRVYDHWSYELGMTQKFKWFCIGLRTDVVRWEPCIDIGLRLKYKCYEKSY